MQTEEATQEELALDPANEAATGTAEQPETPEAPAEEKPVEAKAEEKPVEQSKPKNSTKPFQARIDELTGNWRRTERELEAARAELEAVRKGQQQPAEQQADEGRSPDVVPANMVEKLADQLADQKAAQRQFDNDCNLAFVKGKAAHPEDFEDAIRSFAALGGTQREVLEDVLATDNPADVLYELGKDADEAARVLALPPKRRLAEMIKMANKPAAKPAVSRAAAPIKPVGGTNAKDFDFADDKADDADWFARRQKAVREAGRV